MIETRITIFVIFSIFATLSILILFVVINIMRYIYPPFNTLLFQAYMLINFLICYLAFKSRLFWSVAYVILLFALSIIIMARYAITTSGTMEFLMTELIWLKNFSIFNSIFLLIVVVFSIYVIKHKINFDK